MENGSLWVDKGVGESLVVRHRARRAALRDLWGGNARFSPVAPRMRHLHASCLLFNPLRVRLRFLREHKGHL